MKRTILIAAITLFAATAFGQQHLPPKVKLELTDKQVIKLSTSIDTLYMALQQSNLPAVTVNHIINQAQIALAPVWGEVGKQMVKDSLDKKKGAQR